MTWPTKIDLTRGGRSTEGTWVADDTPINCIPKTCKGNPTGPSGGSSFDPNVNDLDYSTPSCPSIDGDFEGTGCDATCMAGYTADSSTRAHYQCKDDGKGQDSSFGKWAEGTLKCIGNTCAAAPPQDKSGSGGTPVSHATDCKSQAHYDRLNPQVGAAAR
jgi:hypothetical protein